MALKSKKKNVEIKNWRLVTFALTFNNDGLKINTFLTVIYTRTYTICNLIPTCLVNYSSYLYNTYIDSPTIFTCI